MVDAKSLPQHKNLVSRINLIFGILGLDSIGFMKFFTSVSTFVFVLLLYSFGKLLDVGFYFTFKEICIIYIDL